MKHMLLLWVGTFVCLLLSAQESALVTPTHKPEHSVPDLFRLKVPEKTMVKIDLLNTFRRLNGQEAFGLLNVGLERKLGASFSLDTRVATAYHLSLGKVQAQAWDGTIGLDIGPRYYYNLRRRMWKSRNADNLSANYVSLVATTGLVFPRIDPRIVEPLGNFYFHKVSVSPVYGIQRRIGKWMYLDVQTGLRFFRQESTLSTHGLIISTPHMDHWKISTFSTVRFGVAF